ncbi:hypothetical protein HYDPIDRAFT_34409 [Hydnomerulius pinastri MD-312]|uniref:PAP-associated domain-containing protein n=1 Tax=Hydnomerulius pinastri MD-312 TaxID=994086 RepID=A0A0C9UYX0_9AGAM|nr:hypothetical protein HYDPIDRAFT_34409 [Hydnomerulius pinastri MD-312]
MKTESLGQLLMDFLEYYGHHFPYETYYVSVADHTIVPKAGQDWIKNDPGRLSVQCLANLERDLTKSAHRIEEVKDGFKDSFRLMKECTTPSMHGTAAWGGLLKSLKRNGGNTLRTLLCLGNWSQIFEFSTL